MNETHSHMHSHAALSGKKAGEAFSAGGWMVGGVFLGLLMPLISHAMKKPEPPSELLAAIPVEERLGFADAYGGRRQVETEPVRLDRDGDLLRDDPHADPVRRLPLRDGHRDGHDVRRRTPADVPPPVTGGQAGSGSTGAKSRFRSASIPSSRRIRLRSA